MYLIRAILYISSRNKDYNSLIEGVCLNVLLERFNFSLHVPLRFDENIA